VEKTENPKMVDAMKQVGSGGKKSVTTFLLGDNKELSGRAKNADRQRTSAAYLKRKGSAETKRQEKVKVPSRSPCGSNREKPIRRRP